MDIYAGKKEKYPSTSSVVKKQAASPDSWQARLELGFSVQNNRTALTHRHHRGPLVVQKPFYPEGEIPHVYIVHPPGGVVGGDYLSISIKVDEKSHALITTPGSGKIYRSGGEIAQLQQNIKISRFAKLEWLPQDTILFAGCEADMYTRIDLEQDAAFIGWEILCFGRPHSGEAFDRGACRQRFELWRNEQPLLLDRSRYQGGSPLLTAAWGLQGHPVMATMVATNAGSDMIEAVRAVINDEKFSVTLLDDVLVCRYMGEHGAKARDVFTQVWSVIRPAIMNKSVCPPRVWAT